MSYDDERRKGPTRGKKTKKSKALKFMISSRHNLFRSKPRRQFLMDHGYARRKSKPTPNPEKKQSTLRNQTLRERYLGQKGVNHLAPATMRLLNIIQVKEL